ncbi:MAG: hypothetical protein KAX80_16010, partial [Planctomycetes bacterium]|nr:hypothetical protein [Planctomycetota bacterium]
MLGNTEGQIESMKRHVEAGGDPANGVTWDEEGHRVGEGWMVNPAYHACQMPADIRFLEHFELPFDRKKVHDSLRRYAEFSLQHLGGDPFDLEAFRRAYLDSVPDRFSMMIPLALHAYSLTGDDKYKNVAGALFDEYYSMSERNPLGYWCAKKFAPEAAWAFDTVYGPVSYHRGILAFWAEDMLDVIGRERAETFATAQARYFAFSGQLLSSLHADCATAIYTTAHWGHPNIRNQAALYLYDDFDFYRGLVGRLIVWSAAGPPPTGGPSGGGEGDMPLRTLALDYGGSYTLRWALGVGRRSKWNHVRAEELEGGGFRVSLLNTLPWAQPTGVVLSHQVGFTPPHRELMRFRLMAPAYREFAELEVR